MKKTKRFGLKTLATLALAFVMVLSLFVMTACGSDETPSSSSSSSSTKETATITDFQTITNGDFEFGSVDKKPEDYPVTSSFNWTRSNYSLATTSHTSDYSSGIIDTDESVYNLTAKKGVGFPVESGEGDNTVYFNPRTPYYYGLIKDSYVYSETTANNDKLPTTGTKILMIHNELNSEDNRGTAQMFTSSKLVSIESDSYAKVSVWVLTKNLKTKQNTDEFGAYVSLKNTVGSEKENFTVENINTNGQWAQVNIYIKSSDLCSSSYKVVLGLGKGSREVMAEYVEGYAYFDNVTTEIITAEEYNSAISGIDAQNQYSVFEADTTNVGFFTDTKAEDLTANCASIASYESNGSKSDNYDSTKAVTKLNYALSYDIPETAITSFYSTSTKNTNVYASALADGQVGSAAFNTISNQLSGVANPMGDDAETLYFIYDDGTSYTAESKTFTVKDGEAVLITFYAKVKALSSQKNATVKIIETGTSTTTVKETTTVTSDFHTQSYENESTLDWAKFYIFVENAVGDTKDRSFKLAFDFGPTDFTTEAFDFPDKGYALFTGFEETPLTIEQFGDSSGADYCSVLSLGADLPNGFDSNTSTDTYSISYAAADKLQIENGLTNSVIGYTGVAGGHNLVGGTTTSDYTKPSNVYAGVFNTEYIDNYLEFTAEEISQIKALEKADDNNYLQGIAIKNTEATSFGFVGKKATFSSTTTTLVSVKLKVLGNATAYVYLANGDPLGGFDVLSLKGRNFKEETDGSFSFTDEYAINKQFVQKVTASDCVNGWLEVNFVVTSGNSNIDYRVEIFNGSRDGSIKSEGIVLVESISTSTPTLNTLIAKIKADYNDDATTIEELGYTRIPTLVTYTDDEGNEATKYRKYQESTVFTTYSKAKTIIASFETIDADNEIDETTSIDDEEDESTTAPAPDTNIFLYISSIIIAVVIIIVLIVVVGRKIYKNKVMKETQITQYYNPNSRSATNAKIADNKAKKKIEAENTKAIEQEKTEALQEDSQQQQPAQEENVVENQEATEVTQATEASEATSEAEETPAEDNQ